MRFINSAPEAGDDVHYPWVEKITDAEGHAEPGDVAIFCDVLWNGVGDRNYEKCPAARLKYCYPVFDSTQVPPEWTQIINTHFDAAFVPAGFLQTVLKSCGVAKPIFTLPIAMDMKAFFTARPKPVGQPYVFGVVGAYDFRKNVHMIADAFEATFGLDNPDVQLRMKLTYSLLPEDEAAAFAQKYRGTNIEVMRGKVDEGAYMRFVEDVDCMINIARGEGYSIPAREAVALGKPQILADHFAHQDLAGIDSVRFVRAEIPVPALYPQINERFIGLQYVPHAVDVRAAMRDVYDNRYDYAAKAVANRDAAHAWTVEALKPIYRAIVTPANVSVRGGPDTLNDLGMATPDSYFYERCHALYGDSACRSARNPQLVNHNSNKVVVIGNDGGFFSLFNRYASYLVWEKDADPSRVVLPDWRASAIQEYFGLSAFTSFCYASREEGNGWLHLFEPGPDVQDISVYNDTAAMYDGAYIADDFNEKREPWLTYVHAYRLYQMPEFQRWRRWYHAKVSEYMRPVASIQARIDRNIDMLGDGHRIGVHIRHPSHAIEQPGARLSHIEIYVRAIKEYISREGIENPQIFLATDQDSTIEEMRNHFGDYLHYDTDVKRTSIADDQQFSNLSTNDKMREGHQIQHLTAADPANWSSTMAAEVIADCYSLARCNVLFHIVSNISTAASYINPDLEMVFVGQRHDD
ncbi:hypothetical protein [Caulobacter radicis]|uniref:hypothetical protein n=1 Tax=Caulobacter radicis TaxID=2172650 RepID=UPI0010583AD4|nr:hypothetical protein [Caulobacter radicis]